MIRYARFYTALALLFGSVLLFAHPQPASAQRTSLCGWIESTPKPTLFVAGTDALFDAYGLTEDNFKGVQLEMIQGVYWIIDLDFLAEEDFSHYEQVIGLDPGYYQVHDPEFFSTSGWSSLRRFSWLEPVASCSPTLLEPDLMAGGFVCGQLMTVSMPFNYVFIPDGTESSTSAWWVVDSNLWVVELSRTADMYLLENQYLRIWMPDFDYDGGDLWGETAPLLTSIAGYEVVASCNESPTATPMPPTPTPTATPIPPTPAPTPTATRRPPTPTTPPRTISVKLEAKAGVWPDDRNTYQCRDAVLTVVWGRDETTRRTYHTETKFPKFIQGFRYNECNATFEDVKLNRNTFNIITVAFTQLKKQGELDEWLLLVGSKTTVLRVNQVVLPLIHDTYTLPDVELWPSDGRKAIIVAPRLDVHSASGSQFPRIATVYKGTELAVTGSSNGWWKVCCFNGKEGWIPGGSRPLQVEIDHSFSPQLPTRPASR